MRVFSSYANCFLLELALTQTFGSYLQFQIFDKGRQDLLPVLTQRCIPVGRTSHTAVFNFVSRSLSRGEFWEDGLVAVHHGGIFFLNGSRLSNSRLDDRSINRCGCRGKLHVLSDLLCSCLLVVHHVSDNRKKMLFGTGRILVLNCENELYLKNLSHRRFPSIFSLFHVFVAAQFVLWPR